MTNKQKESIFLLRDSGVSIKEIAERLDLSVNTIKSYCKRHDIKAQTDTMRYCLQCHEPIRQNKNRKVKKFCCDKCRSQWWTANSGLIHRISLESHICPVCGKTFLAYKSKNRVYCSRTCYGKSKEVSHEQ